MWNRLKWLPLAVMAAAYPLTVGLEVLEIPFMEYPWFPNVTQWMDMPSGMFWLRLFRNTGNMVFMESWNLRRRYSC